MREEFEMVRPLKDERGVAMVTALMISVVVLIFSVAVVSLSLHNSGASARDRKRVDAISSAEAGIDATMATIQAAVIDKSQSKYTLPCTVTEPLPETPTAKYDVTVNYYTTYPPSGDPMACPPTTVPAAATLTSKGTSVTGALSASRTMEAEARLAPVYGAFGQAIFSNTGINLNNHLGVSGHQGNDADLYTNGNLSCSNNSNIAGSAFVQGTISLSSSCTFAQDGYAKGSVTMINSALIGHDVHGVHDGFKRANRWHGDHRSPVTGPARSVHAAHRLHPAGRTDLEGRRLHQPAHLPELRGGPHRDPGRVHDEDRGPHQPGLLAGVQR